MIVEELETWLDSCEPTTFPYDAVVGEYRRRGKHFVSEDVLAALVAARESLPERPDFHPSTRLLRRFLENALDKHDGRYDYPSYTGLSLLPMPKVDDASPDAAGALRRRDRLVVQLLADVLGFELAASDGVSRLLPMMRPDERAVHKRFRLAVRAAMPALERLGLAGEVPSDEPAQAALELSAAMQRDLIPLDRRLLQLSMLPVYVMHDEYLFIRVLQLFETTFAMLAVQLRATVQALAQSDAATALARMRIAEATLRESAPLFSLLATMQVEAFRTFREFTDGASAIQSRNYKIAEALCRRPDLERVNSAAYTSVPEIRSRMLTGNATVDDAFGFACMTRRLQPADQEQLSDAMNAYSETLRRWRQTHYRLAVRMLAERSGTGHTEGTAYLSSVRSIDVFRSTHGEEEEIQREAV